MNQLLPLPAFLNLQKLLPAPTPPQALLPPSVKERRMTVLKFRGVVLDAVCFNEADRKDKAFVMAATLLLYGTFRAVHNPELLFRKASPYLHGLTLDFVRDLVHNLEVNKIWCPLRGFTKTTFVENDWLKDDSKGTYDFVLCTLAGLGTVRRTYQKEVGEFFWGLPEWMEVDETRKLHSYNLNEK